MRSIRKLLALLTLGLLLTVLTAHAATWTTIDYPGAAWTAAFGINSAGDIVGEYLDSGGSEHGFLLSAGVFTTIDVPGATGTVTTGINAGEPKQVVGLFNDADGHQHGFVFDGLEYTTLDFPGALFTVAWGIDDAGIVVGSFVKQSTHGFKWSNGSFVAINVGFETEARGINNRGYIVGIFNFDRMFVMSPDDSVRKLPFHRLTTNGINDKKIIVGQAGEGFRFNLKTNRFVGLRFPGGNSTSCAGINDAGQIVGVYLDSSGIRHGFLRTK